MIVYLRPPHEGARDYLERAKVEMERVLGFRGSVVSVKAKGKSIIVQVEINPAWDIPEKEKTNYLADWIQAKVRKVFEVESIAE